jgi:hypothetical protein
MDAAGSRRHGYMNDGRPRAATNQRRETLTGHSGTTLTDAAHLSISEWPTPTVAWANGGQTSRSGDRKGEMLIGGLVRSTWPTPTSLAKGTNEYNGAGNSAGLVAIRKHAMAPSGPTQSGSPGQTEKRGALNPAFPCWLMGYPDEWDACAPTATRSSRRSRLK